MYIGRYIFLHNYRFVSSVPQDFGFLVPNPDPQKYADPRGKISTKNGKKNVTFKTQI